MPKNDLHHDASLANLHTEVKFAIHDRHWSRRGRNGECSTSRWAADATRAYNRASRKASRLQLSRYQAPVEEYLPAFGWDQSDDWTWDELRTEADDWHEENVEQRFNQTFRDASCIDRSYYR